MSAVAYQPFADATDEQFAQAVDELQAGRPVGFRLTRQMTLYAEPDPVKPFEVDFHCINEKAMTAAPRNELLDEHRKGQAWARRNIPKLCRLWREKHGKLPLETHDLRGAASPCPKCGDECSAATDAPLMRRQGTGGPKAGDISLCFSCGELLAFNADLTVRLATAEDLDGLTLEQRATVNTLRRSLRERAAAGRPSP